MTYSDVVGSGSILERKEKYTMKDVAKVMTERGINESQARFIVICSGIYHGVEYSKSIANYHSPKNQIKRMIGA